MNMQTLRSLPQMWKRSSFALPLMAVAMAVSASSCGREREPAIPVRLSSGPTVGMSDTTGRELLTDPENAVRFAYANVLSPEVLRAFLAYERPGNVRELEHSVEHAVAFARCGALEIQHLPSPFSVPESSPLIQRYLDSQDRISLPDILRDCERHLVEWALARSEGNQVRAAELLAIPRTTLRSRVAALKGNETTSVGSESTDENSSYQTGSSDE